MYKYMWMYPHVFMYVLYLCMYLHIHYYMIVKGITGRYSTEKEKKTYLQKKPYILAKEPNIPQKISKIRHRKI